MFINVKACDLKKGDIVFTEFLDERGDNIRIPIKAVERRVIDVKLTIPAGQIKISNDVEFNVIREVYSV